MPAPEHLSPSGWNLWDECPRKWAAKYLEGITSPVGPEAETGSFAHLVLQDVYKETPGRRTLDRAAELAGDLWRISGAIEASTITRGEITERNFKRMAWEGVQGDFDIEEPADVEVVATEHHAKWTERGVPFYCVIDRVNKPEPLMGPGLTVNDYKTGKVPKKDHQAGSHRQVVISAMGTAATIGAPGDNGALLYTSKRKVVKVDTSLEARTAVAREAAGVWADQRFYVDSGATWDDYEACAGPLCGWCPVADRCPEGRARVKADLASWMTPDRGIGAHLVAVAEGMIEVY